MKYKYSYGERFLCKYLFQHYGLINHRDYIHPYISKHKSWLHGKHLDFLFPKLHKAVEIQGGQHSHINSLNGSKSFITQQMSLMKELGADICKDDLCLHHGITVISINVAFERKSTIRRHIIDAVNTYIFPNTDIYTYSNSKPDLKWASYNKHKSVYLELNNKILNSLSLLEQKVLEYLILINRQHQHICNIKQYMSTQNLRPCGTAPKLIRNILINFNKYNFFIKFSPGKHNYITILKPEFIAQLNTFSEIKFMRSIYSVRLFNAFLLDNNGYYSVNQIRQLSEVNNHYPRFANLNSRVIHTAQREINLLTTYNLKIRYIREHRVIKYIKVLMTPKTKSQLAKRNNLIYCKMHHIQIKVA